MTQTSWPLFDLVLTTARLELRLPTLRQLDSLGQLAAAGVHDPAIMPFSTPWTDAPPQQRAVSTMQWHWSQWASWQPTAWRLDCVVLLNGRVVGTQGVGATDFAVRREVATGSWLGKDFQGQGIGTEMRAAVLHLAFAGLGADWATSGAFETNPASLAVSRKLGYREDGIEQHAVRGQAAVLRRLRLSQADWHVAAIHPPPAIAGLEGCRHMFGVEA